MFLVLSCFKNGLFLPNHKEKKKVNYVNCLIEMFLTLFLLQELFIKPRESTNVMCACMCACVRVINVHVITSHDD